MRLTDTDDVSAVAQCGYKTLMIPLRLTDTDGVSAVARGGGGIHLVVRTLGTMCLQPSDAADRHG